MTILISLTKTNCNYHIFFCVCEEESTSDLSSYAFLKRLNVDFFANTIEYVLLTFAGTLNSEFCLKIFSIAYAMHFLTLHSAEINPRNELFEIFQNSELFFPTR